MLKLIEDNSYESETLSLKNQIDDQSERQRFSIKPNTEFILFTSHTPCKYLLID